MTIEKSNNLPSTNNNSNGKSYKNKLKNLGIGLALMTLIGCTDGTKPLSTETKDNGEKVENYTDFSVTTSGDNIIVTAKNGIHLVTYAKSLGRSSFENCISSKEHPEEIFTVANNFSTYSDKIQIEYEK